MSGKAPFFITGGNAKIRVNGVTLAFVTDFRYTIKINHSDVRILGVYEHDTAEPLSYDVNGGFTVVRYVEGRKRAFERDGLTPPNGVSDFGNGIGSWTLNGPIDDTRAAASRALGNLSRGFNIGAAETNITNSLKRTVRNVQYNLMEDGRANESLNPGLLQYASWFDIEFYQKIPGGQTGVSKIRNCRIVQADTQVNKRGVMVQSFQFIANAVDEDSFVSTQSGVGQTTA